MEPIKKKDENNNLKKMHQLLDNQHLITI